MKRTYAKAHPERGFTSSLQQPAQSCGVEVPLAMTGSGAIRGYTFALVPGNPEADGRIDKYSMVARTPNYPNCGVRSFFVDETGVIRYTPEDREAKASDKPLI